MNNKAILTISILLAILTSCSKNKPVFEATIITKDSNPSLTYIPNMRFVQFIDSTGFFLEPSDYNKMLGGDISKGDVILKSEKFSVRVILLENYATGNPRYEMLLRSFSPDLKIIDTYTIASTIGEPMCSGILTENLKIKKTCDDGSEILAHIDEYGKFVEGDK